MDQNLPTKNPAALDFPIPLDTPTPALVIVEERVQRNLEAVIAACGSAARFMPHVKNHRAPWVTRWLVSKGVTACKAATTAEVELALAAGMRLVLWAYPTVNAGHIKRFIASARENPVARLETLVDSAEGLDIWLRALQNDPPGNLSLRVDLDPGMGRTGVQMGEPALELARRLHRAGLLGGWHVYDGHIKDLDRNVRQKQVDPIAVTTAKLQAQLVAEGITSDVVAGASYTFDLWPETIASYVSSGSWTYSSNQHDIELAGYGWIPAAFVLATVISTRNGTATLDAGAKAISPDKPLAERFSWDGKIVLMNEEHSVVESQSLRVGDRVLLVPQHGCTTAYLYDSALVLTASGDWERRAQLGGRR
jgi:3-hydroxy-D-aspartate aldolase